MTMSNLYTKTWRCSCNNDNSLAHKKCKICGDAIPVSVFEQVYQEEIHQQNVEHADEEKKRKVIIFVILCGSLFCAPFLFRLLVWVFELTLLIAGSFAGMVCVINEYKKIKKSGDNKPYGNGVLFVISVLCYLVLVFAIDAWVNESCIMVGIMAVCWLVFIVIHSIRVAKHELDLSIPMDIVWCVVRLLPMVFIFVKTINP